MTTPIDKLNGEKSYGLYVDIDGMGYIGRKVLAYELWPDYLKIALKPENDFRNRASVEIIEKAKRYFGLCKLYPTEIKIPPTKA